VLTGLAAVEHLDATDLDHSVAADRIEACSLGIEDDFTHG
jgi:hypothetical protein